MKKFAVLFLILLPIFSYAQDSRWRITKNQWTEQDEVRFGEFIARLGETVERRDCGRVDTCLRSSANPYAGTDPGNLRLFADCADLPYFLRSYFAWKNGLPMSIQSGVRPRQTQDKDVRYTKHAQLCDRSL